MVVVVEERAIVIGRRAGTSVMGIGLSTRLEWACQCHRYRQTYSVVIVAEVVDREVDRRQIQTTDSET
jgi:hypothetical protein